MKGQIRKHQPDILYYIHTITHMFWGGVETPRNPSVKLAKECERWLHIQVLMLTCPVCAALVSKGCSFSGGSGDIETKHISDIR